MNVHLSFLKRCIYERFRAAQARSTTPRRADPKAKRSKAVPQFQEKRRVGEPLPVIVDADRSGSTWRRGAKPGLLGGLTVLTDRLESGIRTRDRQLIRLLLCHLSYIQVGAKGPIDRRHTVPQRGRTSEAFGTSTIGDHWSFPPALTDYPTISWWSSKSFFM